MPRVTTGKAAPSLLAPALAALSVLLCAALMLNIPYFSMSPGPARDVVGLIEIDGVDNGSVRGHLLLTTVSLREIRVAEAIRGWFDGSYEVLSRSALIPAGQTREDADRRTREQMAQSHIAAAASALTLLGYEIEIDSSVRIREVNRSVPAADVLRAGDVVLSVDGRPVSTIQDLAAAVQARGVGEDITVEVMRETEKVSATTSTVPDPEDASRPIIGIFLDAFPTVELPFPIRFESLGIGGPSAGLMYALGIVDLLDPSDLTGGRTVAGTGVISFEGDVGPVGGVRHKVVSAERAGAHLFLVPLVELREACAAAGDIAVVGVERLEDAVAALRGDTVGDERRCA